MRNDNQSTTPTLLETIQTVIDDNLIDMHIAFPAKIVTYDATTQYADVQIQLMFSYENGTLLQYPVIPNVPVKHPRANGGMAYIHMPLAAGDDVTLLVCHRSLDNWKTSGGMTDPADRRRFNLTDCFALIGGSAIPDAFTPNDATAVEIVNQTAIIQLLASGDVKLGNGNSVIQALNSGTVNLGSASASHPVALADNVLSRIQALEMAVSNFFTAYDSHLHPTSSPGAPTGPPATPANPYMPPSDALGSSKVMVET